MNSIETEALQYANKMSNAPDKETPDWIIQDFKAGVLFAIDRFAKQSWVTVKSKLPEFAIWVLCHDQHGFNYIGFRANGGWYINTRNGKEFLSNGEDNQTQITHWAELPEPPKQ